MKLNEQQLTKMEKILEVISLMQKGIENKLKDEYDCFDFDSIEVPESKETLITEWDMIESFKNYLEIDK